MLLSNESSSAGRAYTFPNIPVTQPARCSAMGKISCSNSGVTDNLMQVETDAFAARRLCRYLPESSSPRLGQQTGVCAKEFVKLAPPWPIHSLAKGSARIESNS